MTHDYSPNSVGHALEKLESVTMSPTHFNVCSVVYTWKFQKPHPCAFLKSSYQVKQWAISVKQRSELLCEELHVLYTAQDNEM